MNSDFPRILCLLRKEKALSQKVVSTSLGVSQALLSHYEKGIRECGLDFLVKCAKFYNVSTDYLLGLSPERKGTTICVEDIPEPQSNEKENRYNGSLLPTLNKKLIFNSLNILYDILAESKNTEIINNISKYLMLAFYNSFRIIYSSNKSNQEEFFNINSNLYMDYTHATMQVILASTNEFLNSKKMDKLSNIDMKELFFINTDILNKKYPLFTSSLLNLINTCETQISTFFDQK